MPSSTTMHDPGVTNGAYAESSRTTCSLNDANRESLITDSFARMCCRTAAMQAGAAESPSTSAMRLLQRAGFDRPAFCADLNVYADHAAYHGLKQSGMVQNGPAPANTGFDKQTRL